MAFEILTSPLAVLAVPVLLSLLARNVLVALSVAAVTLAGAVAAAGLDAGREQWLVLALVSVAGMLFTLHGCQAHARAEAIERLKESLLEVRLATASLRNTIEQERSRVSRKDVRRAEHVP